MVMIRAIQHAIQPVIFSPMVSQQGGEIIEILGGFSNGFSLGFSRVGSIAYAFSNGFSKGFPSFTLAPAFSKAFSKGFEV